MLQKILSNCSQEEREHIAHLWGVGALPSIYHEPDVLLRVMQYPLEARFVWEKLTTDERQILYRVLEARPRTKGISRSLLLQQTQIARKRCEQALTHLKDWWLILEQEAARGQFPESDDNTPQDSEQRWKLFAIPENVTALFKVGQEIFGKADLSLQPLPTFLQGRGWSELSWIAHQYKVPLQASRPKALARRELAEALSQADIALEKVLHSFDPSLQAFYAWLYEQGGRVAIQRVRTFLRHDEAALYKLLQKLSSYVLAFDTFTQQGERIVFIPDEIFGQLQKRHDVLAALAARSPSLPPRVGETREVSLSQVFLIGVANECIAQALLKTEALQRLDIERITPSMLIVTSNTTDVDLAGMQHILENQSFVVRARKRSTSEAGQRKGGSCMHQENQRDQQRQDYSPEMEALAFFQKQIGNGQLQIGQQWQSPNGWMLLLTDGDVSYLAIKYTNGSSWYKQNGSSFEAQEFAEQVTTWAGMSEFESES
jgi:hypothetical protein